MISSYSIKREERKCVYYSERKNTRPKVRRVHLLQGGSILPSFGKTGGNGTATGENNDRHPHGQSICYISYGDVNMQDERNICTRLFEKIIPGNCQRDKGLRESFANDYRNQY